MTDTSRTFGGRAPGNVNTFTSTVGSFGFSQDFPVGTPVCPSASVSDTVIKARGNALATSKVAGVAAAAGVVGDPTRIQYAGPLKLTEEEWDEITNDTGGLVRGTPYYLSQGFGSGKLTTSNTPNSGNFLVPVGIALSSTVLLVQIGAPVQVP